MKNYNQLLITRARQIKVHQKLRNTPLTHTELENEAHKKNGRSFFSREGSIPKGAKIKQKTLVIE